MTQLGDCYVHPGDGGKFFYGQWHFHVRFRLVVLKPTVDEIVQGVIEQSNEEGILVNIDSAYAVFVPARDLWRNAKLTNIQANSDSAAVDNTTEKGTQVWTYQDGIDKYSYDLLGVIRVQINKVEVTASEMRVHARADRAPLGMKWWYDDKKMRKE